MPIASFFGSTVDQMLFTQENVTKDHAVAGDAAGVALGLVTIQHIQRVALCVFVCS